jgi:hypothetical protein
MQWGSRILIEFMHISSLLKILHHLTYFFPASTFFWAASCLSASYHRQQMEGTYNLSLSGLELFLRSLELFLLPLSDVLTLFSLFSLAVWLAHTTQLKGTAWRWVVGVSDVVRRNDMEM